jgi:hypothetical protein
MNALQMTLVFLMNKIFLHILIWLKTKINTQVLANTIIIIWILSGGFLSKSGGIIGKEKKFTIKLQLTSSLKILKASQECLKKINLINFLIINLQRIGRWLI